MARVVRLAFTGLMLTLVWARVDFVSALRTLIRFDLGLLAPLLITYFLSVYVAAYQMSLGLGPLRMRFSVVELIRINLVSIFYSLVLLGDLAGGIAAWYKLSRPDRKGVEAGALLIYFRLLNMATLLGIGLVGVWFDSRLCSSSLRPLVGTMFMGVVLVSLPFFSPAVTRLMERLSRSLFHRLSLPGWVFGELQAAREALMAFQSSPKRTIAFVLGLSLLSHLLGVLNFYLLGLSVGISQSVFVMGWLRSLLVIIQMVPVSIAGLGVREVSLVFILRNYGIPEAQALGLSLTVLGMMTVGGIMGGLFEAWDFLRGRREVSHSVSDGGRRGSRRRSYTGKPWEFDQSLSQGKQQMTTTQMNSCDQAMGSSDA